MATAQKLTPANATNTDFRMLVDQCYRQAIANNASDAFGEATQELLRVAGVSQSSWQHTAISIGIRTVLDEIRNADNTRKSYPSRNAVPQSKSNLCAKSALVHTMAVAHKVTTILDTYRLFGGLKLGDATWDDLTYAIEHSEKSRAGMERSEGFHKEVRALLKKKCPKTYKSKSVTVSSVCTPADIARIEKAHDRWRV